MCQRMGVTEDAAPGKTSGLAAVVPVHVVQPKEKAAIEMQLGALQIKFNECPPCGAVKGRFGCPDGCK